MKVISYPNEFQKQSKKLLVVIVVSVDIRNLVVKTFGLSSLTKAPNDVAAVHIYLRL